MTNPITINVQQLSTGFLEVPGQVSLNIYAQGCKKRCPDCHNINGQSFEGGMKLFISNIDPMLQDFSLCKWICWLGGDAVYQPDAFQSFNREFASRGYKIALYTGMQYQEIKDLLVNVNLVIDGEWCGIPVTSSKTNQTIWYRNSLTTDFTLIKNWDTLNTTINS